MARPAPTPGCSLHASEPSHGLCYKARGPWGSEALVHSGFSHELQAGACSCLVENSTWTSPGSIASVCQNSSRERPFQSGAPLSWRGPPFSHATYARTFRAFFTSNFPETLEQLRRAVSSHSFTLSCASSLCLSAPPTPRSRPPDSLRAGPPTAPALTSLQRIFYSAAGRSLSSGIQSS